jgi:hypothetical protein
LRLAAEAGLLLQSRGVYRDERLAVERPGWRWLGEVEAEGFVQEYEREILNPSEDALRALLDARKNHPTCELVSLDQRYEREDGERNSEYVVALADDFLGRRIVMEIE